MGRAKPKTFKEGMTMYSGELYSMGIPFYHASELKEGRKVKAYVYFLARPISDSQREQVKARLPHASFGTTCKEYAPELRSACIIIPSQAELKRQKKRETSK